MACPEAGAVPTRNPANARGGEPPEFGKGVSNACAGSSPAALSTWTLMSLEDEQRGGALRRDAELHYSPDCQIIRG
jgi:hypothetical protein